MLIGARVGGATRVSSSGPGEFFMLGGGICTHAGMSSYYKTFEYDWSSYLLIWQQQWKKWGWADFYQFKIDNTEFTYYIPVPCPSSSHPAIFSLVHPKLTQIGHESFFKIFEYEEPTY
jgi:hypothetical protein